MSLPARRLETPPPARRPGARPARRTAPAGPARQPARRPSERSRRHRPLGFVILSSAIVGSMVFGIVVLHVLLAQASFRLSEGERRLETLSREHLELVGEQATLSAPGRIAAWASRHGMRLPDDIRILHASGVGSADPAGADSDAPTSAQPAWAEDPSR